MATARNLHRAGHHRGRDEHAGDGSDLARLSRPLDVAAYALEDGVFVGLLNALRTWSAKIGHHATTAARRVARRSSSWGWPSS